MRMFYIAGLILCLGAVLVSAERACPYQEEVEPCICVDYGGAWVTLTCTKLHDTQVLLRVFDNARELHFDKFILIESSLQYIPHQIFDDVVVKVLQMENVTLRTMFDEVPRDPDIWEIHAKGVKILGGMDWKKLSVFKNLKYLYIWDMPMKKLSDDFRSIASKKLSVLYCNNCKIKQLGDNVFADFPDLRNIQLPYNAIVDIKKTMFRTRTKLTIINLEFNKISTLPEDVFSDMPFLHEVKLKGNQMALLPEGPFQPVISQLTILDVRQNPIKCDCRIKWVLQERSGVVRGNCYAPKAIHDRPFDHLTRRDIRC